MNDSQINIAIAEACGWTLVKDDPDFYEYWEHPKDGRKIGVAANSSPFPDYCNDLNAMHEAEKVLTRYQQSVTYSDNLMKIVGYHTFDSAHAPSRQRAEAFLRTIGKWEEVKP